MLAHATRTATHACLARLLSHHRTTARTSSTMNQPVMVMNQNAKRETGSIARANNIAAAKAVSDIIRTTLGPRSMLKMILDASGGA
jgi:hypothetical protein